MGATCPAVPLLCRDLGAMGQIASTTTFGEVSSGEGHDRGDARHCRPHQARLLKPATRYRGREYVLPMQGPGSGVA